jgi:hypothetical protein
MPAAMILLEASTAICLSGTIGERNSTPKSVIGFSRV